jgi:DNA-directed RNA polymerase specialized sigma24 family protein
MDRPQPSFPPVADGFALHLRLCDQDSTTPADVCQAYLGPLLAWLESRSRHADPHLLQTAAQDALLAYVQRPQAYDPARLDLGAYLRMAARRDLLNLLCKERRHHRGRIPWGAVEEDEDGGNLIGREEEPLVGLERAEEAEAWCQFLRQVAEGFTEGERGVLGLLLAGERRTAAYAAVVGCGGLPGDEQEREVKRVKDRVKKRLERGGGSSD